MKKNILVALLLTFPAVLILYKYLNSEFSYSWPEDKVTNYEFRYESQGNSYGSSIGLVHSIVQDQQVNAELVGNLAIEKVEDKGDFSLLKVTINKYVYKYQYVKDRKVTEVPYVDLSFYVDWNEKTGFEDIYFPRETLNEHEHVLKDLLSLLELQLPKAHSLAWEAKHDSVVGKEIIAYQYSPFIRTFFKSGELTKSYIHQSDEIKNSGAVTFEVNGEKLIESVSGSKAETYLLGDKVVSENKKTLQLRFESFTGKKNVLTIEKIEGSRNFKVRNLDGEHTKERLGKMADMEIVSGRSYKQIISSLIDMNTLEIKDQANMFQSLSSYMRVYPNSVGKVMDLLKQYSKGDFQFDIISTALGDVGTPEVQALMRDYINDASGDEKSQVMLNLAFVSTPTAKTEELYWDLYSSATDTTEKKKSLYAVGIMTSHMDPDSSRYEASVENLTALYGQVSASSDKRTVIKAMANTRSPEFFDEMEQVIAEDDDLKLVALASLKDIQTNDSKMLLLDYSGSSELDEKYVAVRSLSSYELDKDVLDKYEDILESETNRKVTAQVLKNLDSAKKTDASIQVARNYLNICPTGDLCKLARRALD